MNESLRRQETQFKAHCKEEKARLEAGIARLQGAAGEGDMEEQVRLLLLTYDLDVQYIQCSCVLSVAML